jgi:hypothetical protein
MGRRGKLMFLGWTVPNKNGYVNRELGRSDLFDELQVRDAMQHEGDKLKAFLKVKKLVPRYSRS